ncbi:MAG: RNA 3'-terminal phosphate cyclase [Candidatus Bathyarchaeota archaeon]|nr:MAG: RNA 3'-terminal phosphate cyclase [Candidatus Bathyarchaeota archaeon]
MLEIDGSQKSGSGTILRLSIALAGILNEPLHIYKIRQRRTQPGLRPQHLEAVLTAAKLCNAETKGAKIGSRELWFEPSGITGGDLHAEIGTAGSIPMLLLTILPLCAIAKETVRIHVTRGGTDVRYAPTINYIKHVLLPVLEQMGLETRLDVKKYGYYPKGMGEISLEVQPCSELKPLRLKAFGNVEEVKGTSVCTFLAERKVAERQAKTASKILKTHGCEAQIEVVNDTSNPLQKGSSLVLWAKTSTDALLGGDAIGEIRKLSEIVGREAAENLAREIEARATVDVHLADMLVPYMALAKGRSTYLCRRVTEHLDTNMWLAQKILDVKFEARKAGSIYKIKRV